MLFPYHTAYTLLLPIGSLSYKKVLWKKVGGEPHSFKRISITDLLWQQTERTKTRASFSYKCLPRISRNSFYL